MCSTAGNDFEYLKEVCQNASALYCAVLERAKGKAAVCKPYSLDAAYMIAGEKLGM